MLKSVLALLLSKFVKRSEKEFIGSQAFPSSSSVSLTIPSSANLTTYGSFIMTVAPFDGYATLSSGNRSSEYTFGVLSGQIESKIFSKGESTYLYIPIKKGANIDFYCLAARDNPEILKSLRAKFVKNLGSA